MSKVTHTLSNPGFETGDLTGWTAGVGTARVLSAETPHSGTYYIEGGSNEASTSVYQDIDLVADGILAADIDAGDVSSQLDWFQSTKGDDQARMSFQYLDTGMSIISYDPAVYEITEVNPVWTARGYASPVPALTRHIRIRCEFNRLVGNENNGQIDDITMFTKTADILETGNLFFTY